MILLNCVCTWRYIRRQRRNFSQLRSITYSSLPSYLRASKRSYYDHRMRTLPQIKRSDDFKMSPIKKKNNGIGAWLIFKQVRTHGSWISTKDLTLACKPSFQNRLVCTWIWGDNWWKRGGKREETSFAWSSSCNHLPPTTRYVQKCRLMRCKLIMISITKCPLSQKVTKTRIILSNMK